jgi:purine-binding chemotaxis protein CheW
MEQQFVVFSLDDENYAVDIAAVESIIKMQEITAVPHSPAYVMGVTNLRGSVIPVMNLRRRLNLSVQENTDDTRIMVVIMDGVKIGMVVDDVSEVMRFAEEAIEPPPDMVLTDRSRFLKGIAKVDNHMIILLNLDEVLAAEEKAVLAAL